MYRTNCLTKVHLNLSYSVTVKMVELNEMLDITGITLRQTA